MRMAYSVKVPPSFERLEHLSLIAIQKLTRIKAQVAQLNDIRNQTLIDTTCSEDFRRYALVHTILAFISPNIHDISRHLRKIEIAISTLAVS